MSLKHDMTSGLREERSSYWKISECLLVSATLITARPTHAPNTISEMQRANTFFYYTYFRWCHNPFTPKSEQFPLQLHQKYYITQYEELAFPWLTQIKDDYTTNSQYLMYTFPLKRLGECPFLIWECLEAIVVTALHVSLPLYQLGRAVNARVDFHHQRATPHLSVHSHAFSGAFMGGGGGGGGRRRRRRRRSRRRMERGRGGGNPNLKIQGLKDPGSERSRVWKIQGLLVRIGADRRTFQWSAGSGRAQGAQDRTR